MKVSMLLLLFLFTCILAICQEQPRIIQTTKTATIIPEGIAAHSNGTLYVTSIEQKKIITIAQDGSHSDFISSGAYGFGTGVGIKLDEKRNRLWVISDKKEKEWTVAQVHIFSLSSKHLIKTLAVKDTVNHFFNDLTIDTHGNAWVTATYSGELFFVDSKLERLKLISKDTMIKYPNGIAYKNEQVYIATYGSGLLRYDVKSGTLFPLTGYTDTAHAFNFDGLGFYGNKLYGVYNGAENNSDNAIVEYVLNNEGTQIIAERIFASGHPMFYEPTTLSIKNNKLYLLANSHLGFYNKNKESVLGIEEKLTPVTILVYNLK